ncbi:Antibiotic biosynthesis monooxygenase [Planctomycetales bacterium 10988]|nr:Antibiotic biosynthesis monooxygenase [Planctomycetales bacterium 10988]
MIKPLPKTLHEGFYCAVTCIPQQGKEAEFEAALKRFLQRSFDHEATTGAFLLRPAPSNPRREYGVLRSFLSEEDSKEFYNSELFQEWQTEIRELVEQEPDVRRLHGLEAFFRGQHHPPPRWKMALVTWVGVFPSIYIWSLLLRSPLSGYPQIVTMFVLTVVMVITLTWFVMPILTRLARPWLQAK